MNKLMPLEEWRIKRFTTPPSGQTARRWAQNGEIPGARKIGGTWYVDIEDEQKSTGNELVDSVLRAS
jgi:hypothetical protein